MYDKITFGGDGELAWNFFHGTLSECREWLMVTFRNECNDARFIALVVAGLCGHAHVV